MTTYKGAMPAAGPTPPGIAREKKTVEAMVRIYCADHAHVTTGAIAVSADGCLCESCRTLLTYSHHRLDRCPYGDEKPSCKACPIHCYRPAERESMRQVMREAGPRMLWRHPWLAIVHLWKDAFGKEPKRKGGVTRG
jgi:hypothetical protein